MRHPCGLVLSIYSFYSVTVQRDRKRGGEGLLGHQQVAHDRQRRRLDGEQVGVVYEGAALPHELGQPQEVLQVVARLAAAQGDLGANLLGAGWPQVQGVVLGGDVHQRRHGGPVLLAAAALREEVHGPGDVAAAHRLTHVQVLEGLLHLGAGHLEGHAPSARLQRQEEEGTLTIYGVVWDLGVSALQCQ